MVIFLLSIGLFGCKERVEVKLDSADSVIYGFGGGELGAPWTEITIKGDGTLEYFFSSSGNRMVRELKLSPERTQELFQGLVHDGLFQLRSEKQQGADIPVITIKAHINGKDHEARITMISEKSEEWEQVIGHFQRVLNSVLPEKL